VSLGHGESSTEYKGNKIVPTFDVLSHYIFRQSPFQYFVNLSGLSDVPFSEFWTWQSHLLRQIAIAEKIHRISTTEPKN
jgi:hypothetical protein